MASNGPSRHQSQGLHESNTSHPPPPRGNLFSSTLSRRPQSTTLLQPTFHHSLDPSSSTTAPSRDTKPSASSTHQSTDIIVRDPHGNYRLDQPALPPMPRSELQEEREAENRLIETFRKHSQHVDQAEVRATLWSSLQGKAAGLEEDGWMFGEEEGEGQGGEGGGIERRGGKDSRI